MISRLFALVVLLALVAGGYYLWKASPRSLSSLDDVGAAVGDAKTAASVKTALALNRSLKPYDVHVAVERGVATLRGEVGSDRLRQQADEIVTAVPGVRQVVNHLSVGPSKPEEKGGGRSLGESLDDGTLEVQVKLALSLRGDLKDCDIDVGVFRREVTLSGELVRSGQREIALETTRQVSGVAAVVDRLRIRGQPEAAGALADAVRAALAANANLARYRLDAVAEGNRVVLRGRVKTSIEKDLAGLVAERAAGNVSIENALEILP